MTYLTQTVCFEGASLGVLNPIPGFKGLPRIKAFLRELCASARDALIALIVTGPYPAYRFPLPALSPADGGIEGYPLSLCGKNHRFHSSCAFPKVEDFTLQNPACHVVAFSEDGRTLRWIRGKSQISNFRSQRLKVLPGNLVTSIRPPPN